MSLLDEYRRARRSQILVAARRMIVERGYEAVTIRDLASECGVSVPTLYNQFGGKDALLAEAIEEQFRESLHTEAFERAEPGLERLLTVIDQSARQLLESATYSQRLLAAFSAIRSTTALQQKVGEAFVEVLIAELSVMQKRRQLLPWVDLPRLAGQLVSANIGIVVQWSSALLASDELQAAMRYAMGLVLLGVLRGAARDRVAHMVEAAQAGFASPPRERDTEASQ
jgi:TetR/AcrR family transcriptional repressor of mexJK operon